MQIRLVRKWLFLAKNTEPTKLATSQCLIKNALTQFTHQRPEGNLMMKVEEF